MSNKILTALVLIVVASFGFYIGKVTTHEPTKAIQAGSVSSPDVTSPYLSFGGVRSWAYSPDFRTATSTLCSIQSPAATTTLVSFTANFATAAVSYANDYQAGNAATSQATTTNLGKITVAANGLGTLVATSTSLTDNIIPPLTFVNLRVSTTTASSSYAPTGKCNVVFREV